MALHIGTSGWSYNHWEGVFYPLHTPVHARLKFYVARFPTVEINATFYRWPKTATFESWQKRLPPGFLMSVKAPRFLTHNKRLLNPESWLERSGAAYCIMSGSRLPCILRATAPFVYVRLHGPDQQQLYGGSYSDDDLRWWADRLREWQAQQRDVFVYFNNDWGGNAVRNAGRMRALLGL